MYQNVEVKDILLHDGNAGDWYKFEGTKIGN